MGLGETVDRRYLPASQTLFTESRTNYHVDGLALVAGVVSLLSQVDASYSKMVGERGGREE